MSWSDYFKEKSSSLYEKSFLSIDKNVGMNLGRILTEHWSNLEQIPVSLLLCKPSNELPCPYKILFTMASAAPAKDWHGAKRQRPGQAIGKPRGAKNVKLIVRAQKSV